LLEARDTVCAGVIQLFERDVLTAARVDGFVDGAKATRSERPQDLEARPGLTVTIPP
jgi:hypothetical protein